jgi:hypothetical protein
MSSSSRSSISICLWVKACWGDQNITSCCFVEDTDGLYEHSPPHGREDAVDVVFLEIFHI